MNEYEVEITIERIATLTVHAENEKEAKKKALEWDSIDEITECEEIQSVDEITLIGVVE